MPQNAFTPAENHRSAGKSLRMSHLPRASPAHTSSPQERTASTGQFMTRNNEQATKDEDAIINRLNDGRSTRQRTLQTPLSSDSMLQSRKACEPTIH